MNNREKKRELIESGIYREYIKSRSEVYKRTQTEDMTFFDVENRKAEFNRVEREFAQKYGFGVLKCLQQIHEASRKRRKNAERHVLWWLDNLDLTDYVIALGTITFSDDMLAEWGEKWRREQVQMLLKSACADYIADIDFGERNGREHYHFIGLLSRDDLYQVEGTGKGKGKMFYKSKTLDKWGAFTDLREVIESEKDRKKAVSYMSKVTNYALKGGQSKMIVAKGTPFQEEQACLRAEKQTEKERRSHELEGQKLRFKFQSVQEAYAFWEKNVHVSAMDSDLLLSADSVDLLSVPFDELLETIQSEGAAFSSCFCPAESEVQATYEVFDDDESGVQELLRYDSGESVFCSAPNCASS